MQRRPGHEIHAISNLMGRRIEEEKRKRGMAELTPVQSWIIGYLDHCRNRDVFQRDIERDFDITRSTVTGILKLMEKKGYIERMSVPEDARLKKIVLTDKGRELHEEMREHIKETEENLVRGLTPEELATLMELLQKIKQNLIQ